MGQPSIQGENLQEAEADRPPVPPAPPGPLPRAAGQRGAPPAQLRQRAGALRGKFPRRHLPHRGRGDGGDVLVRVVCPQEKGVGCRRRRRYVSRRRRCVAMVGEGAESDCRPD
jgi:hypothetical protein